MQKKGHSIFQRITSAALSVVMTVGLFASAVPAALAAENAASTIQNKSLSVQIGDLGQISVLNIKNNPKNSSNKEINFVLPNNTSNQNGTQHQWMGEMIFSTRTSDDGNFTGAFTEVDTNRTLAAGGSTTASKIAADNPYITKTTGDNTVEVNYIGQSLDSTTSRTMKGFNAKSVYDMNTDDGSLLWSITLENVSDKYIEFGDVGLPMPWNNKYTSQTSVYNERVTAHTFAGADSGYAYAIRCSGEGNFVMFTPVVSTGARIEYIDNWIGNNNGVTDNRSGSLYTNWTGDSGGWQPGLSVYYIHSKDIQKTGRGYFTDSTSLVLAPGESKTYQFKFSAVRAGDNDPQEDATSPNNASVSVEERETNMRSILYKEGLIDAVAVPSFQTAINMDTKLDLHYDDAKISDVQVDILCVHENDPFDKAHIPTQTSGRVNNSRTGQGTHDGNPDFNESVEFVETKTVNGEQHHIYNLKFGCIGNNSVRVSYKLNGEEKFTEYEFNVLAKLDDIIQTHADFMVDYTQDTNPASATFGIFSDWYFASGKDSNQKSHWGDDWSHDNINFITMKNFLNPDVDQIKAIENYLIDFMWDNYMKYTQETFTVANYLSASGIYSTAASPYTRTFSEMMEATGFFNMYRIEKAYPDLMEYRQPATYYLEKAYGIYSNRVGTGAIGFYGEQQIPAMIEALYAEGMTAQADNLKNRFAYTKGRAIANSSYPYGSEFTYDNTGEEGAYSAAKALRNYYPSDSRAANALLAMRKANLKTRAMRGWQPTWYQYADPAFIGGEAWWNFQYTASLAGFIMDQWTRYDGDDTVDSPAWGERLNYAAKLSNFNAVNMGQIASTYVGNVSWRYNMYKGGYGAMNVNDGGTRVMNNGWQDFSGESDEGLYGSLLSISSDVATDEVFGLFGYGCNVTKEDGVYTIVPQDGIGKRINLIDEKIYLELIQDAADSAVIAADGSTVTLNLRNIVTTEHVSEINLSGAGVADGFYAVSVNGEQVGQVFVKGNVGTVSVVLSGETSVVTVTKLENGENQAPVVTVKASSDELQAVVPFTLSSTVTDDGAPNGTLTYAWSVSEKPEGANVTFSANNTPNIVVKADQGGKYVFTLVVSDGDETGFYNLEATLADAPERQAPVINAASGKQDLTNPTVAKLSAEATGDALYEGTLVYSWTVVNQPEGGNAVIAENGQNARLMVGTSGSYELLLTVTDADKVSTKTVTVTMDASADGVQRGGNVVTMAGTAPVLPATMSVILPDGTVATKEVTWNEVPADNYAGENNFEVRGVVTGTEIPVAVTVYSVTADRVNIAPIATPTAIINTPSDLGGVAGLNDGKDPSNSADTSNGVWHNWQGAQGDPAWVVYTWKEPVIIDGQDAYYFRDGGGNFFPKSVALEYKDANGEWQPLPNVKGLGVTRNAYNTTTWDPVRTTALRMTMAPATLGIGVIEWKVYGYYEVPVDFTELENALKTAKNLLPIIDLFEAGSDATLNAAIETAEGVLTNPATKQGDVEAAAAALMKVVNSLKADVQVVTDTDVAVGAKVESDYTSSWENLAGINNPAFEPTRSNDGTGKGWGNWSQSVGSEHYVGYTWTDAVTVGGADIYWYDDGGGTQVPSAMRMQYMDENGKWQDVTLLTPVSSAVAKHTYNRVYFAPVTTTRLRLYVTVKSGAAANGIYRFKLYAPLDENKPINDVIALIDAIGTVTLDSQAAIEEARAAYELLTDEQKAAVTNYETLVAAEEALAALKDAIVLEIIKQPEDHVGAIGSVAAFSVEVTREDVTYVWMFSKNNGTTWAPSTLEGCDTDTVIVPLTALRVGQQYKCVVTDSKGNFVETEVVTMSTGELTIVTQPFDFSGAIGNTATFTVEAQGEGLTYQWFYSNNSGASWSKSSMTGSTTASISVVMTKARVGQMYKVVVTDANGNVAESVAVGMTTASDLKIVTDPTEQIGAVGTSVTFAVEAQGEGLTYCWMYSNNGGQTWSKSVAEGADTAQMNIAVKAFRAGQLYKCVVTDVNGNVVESAPARIVVAD